MIVMLLAMGLLPQDPAPARPLSQLMHTVWTPKQGGGPTAIKALAQTTDGYLWIGTNKNLVRFDGVRFVDYVPLSGDSIPEGTISRLLATKDGAIWLVGTRESIAIRIFKGHATRFGKSAGVESVLHLAESSQGEVVAASMYGVFRLVGDRWEDLGKDRGIYKERVHEVFFDHADGLWVRGDARIAYLPPGGNTFITVASHIGPSRVECKFAETSDGTVWLADQGNSVYPLNRPGDRPVKPTRVHVGPLAMLIDRRGSLWIASGGEGLFRVPAIDRIMGQEFDWLDPRLERFTLSQGGLSDLPTALLEDRQGNIWVGSAGGLERFQEAAFSPVVMSGSARPRFVQAFSDSSIWTGAYNHPVLERIGPSGRDSVVPGFPMVSVARDRQGRLLVVDGRDRLLRLEGKRFRALPLKRDNARSLYSLTTDPAGNVWVYSRERGLLRLEGDRLVQMSSLQDQANNPAILFSDRRGGIWVAQPNRVSRFANGTLTRFEKKEGIFGFVYGFVEDRDGTVWAFTGDGLSRHTGDRFQTLVSKRQVPGGTVYSAAPDDEGYWWVAALPGILRYPPGELERALADSNYVPSYRIFDEADGMVGALVKGYWAPILVKAADGKIWTASDSGLSFIDPRKIPAEAPPPVSLEVMRMRGREHPIVNGAEIPPLTRDLEIDYSAVTFTDPEVIRFRYRLEGADTTWHDVGNRRRAYYTELVPRSYRFVVSSSYGNGVWNEAGAAWTFRVLPAWFQTLWFKALLVLAIAGLGGTLAAVIQRQRHRQAEKVLKDRYEATLAERARIAQDLHDTLLQGFAGVALQLKTVELALPEQPDVAAETITRVQRLTRESLREARERVWEMHGTDLGDDDLPTALETVAREQSDGSGMSVRLHVSGDRRRLSRVQEDVAFRAGREAIVNALRHSGGTTVEIDVAFGPRTLALEVRDDGRGFTHAEADEARRKGHFGLTGIQERARQTGGACEITPRTGGGTVVRLTLPLV